MSSWQLIFLQSTVNNTVYQGDRLSTQIWHWPEGTWFQKRRSYLRTKRRLQQQAERERNTE